MACPTRAICEVNSEEEFNEIMREYKEQKEKEKEELKRRRQEYIEKKEKEWAKARERRKKIMSDIINKIIELLKRNK